MNKRIICAFICLFIIVVSALIAAEDSAASSEIDTAVKQDVDDKSYSFEETSQARDLRMAWWRQARFGMFIHWGVYSIHGGNWGGREVDWPGEWAMHRAQIPVSEYEILPGMFNPVKFDAKQWVKIAKDAGFKYIVITSKHHDGFCMWDSAVTKYDIMDAAPFKRDILAELSKACRQEGIKLCFYHSITDWHHPNAQALHYPSYNTDKKKNPNFDRYVEDYLKPQVRELLTGYGPLGVMWFDGEWIPEWTAQHGREMDKLVRSLQPNIIINNRVGKGRKGAGDFGTPEQEIPAEGIKGFDWESCMTMNESWGYKSYDNDWKSTEQLIHNLVDITSKGGNYLLNVGPTSEGLFPQPCVERLKEIGKWLKVNGESIYGTSASVIGKVDWGRCTVKNNKLYLHIFDWPKSGKLTVAKLPGKVQKAYLLANKQLLDFTVSDDNSVVIDLPNEAPDETDTVVVLEVNTTTGANP